jgi:hypothetical protein
MCPLHSGAVFLARGIVAEEQDSSFGGKKKTQTTPGLGRSSVLTEACPSVEELVAERHQRRLTPIHNHARFALVPGLPIVERFGRFVRGACQYFILPCRSSQPNSCGRRAAPGSITALIRDALPELNERSRAGRISSGRVTYSPWPPKASIIFS